MLNEIQKNEIVVRTKQRQPLKTISLEMGIPGPTISNYLRRSHPNLLRWSREKRQTYLSQMTQKVSKAHGIPDSKAQSIVEDLIERLDNKKRNTDKEFSISLQDIEINSHCPYLGIKLDFDTYKHKDDAYPTFDRIDNTLGYVKGNVVLCSWRANRLKSDGTAEEHRRIADYLCEKGQ